MTTVLVVGAGPVGTGIAAGLGAAGAAELSVRRWSRADGDARLAPAADVAVLAVRDDAIADLAQRLVRHGAAGPTTVLLHCAGVLPPSQAFAAVRAQVGGAGLLHPLRSLAGRDADALSRALVGTVMAVCGDEAGVAAALRLSQVLGGAPLRLDESQLGLYHAAAVLSAGHVAALLGQAIDLLVGMGLGRPQAERALSALCASVAQNVAQVGLPAALTGPAARGDVATVGRHLAALHRASPSAEGVYRALLPAALELSAQKGAAAPADLAAIAALLRG